MLAPSYESRRPVYRRLWAEMRYDPGREAGFRRSAAKIADAKARYVAVAAATGCPWWLIGCLHLMESGGRFDRHLHNGDPLTARTRQVPAGRPKTGAPPFTWEESAIDALLMKATNRISAWPVERVAYFAETYNGWGYLKRKPSPYLWAGTNHDPGRGKYVADGKYDPNAPSEGQDGVMGILRALMELDPSIRPGFDVVDKPLAKSRTTQGAGAAAAGGAVVMGQGIGEAIRQVQEAEGHIAAGTWVGIAIAGLILLGAAYALYARWDDAGRPLPWGAK